MSELQTISVTIGILTACISVVIGVVNQILSRRRTEAMAQLTLETRQAQLFMQIYNRWTSRDVTKSYGAIRYKYSKEEYAALETRLLNPPNSEVDLDVYANYQMLATFFEGLGILVKRGLVDISLVEDLFSRRIIWYWEYHVEPLAEKYRQVLQDPTLYDELEYLYHEMKQRQQQATIST